MIAILRENQFISHVIYILYCLSSRLFFLYTAITLIIFVLECIQRKIFIILIHRLKYERQITIIIIYIISVMRHIIFHLPRQNRTFKFIDKNITNIIIFINCFSNI